MVAVRKSPWPRCPIVERLGGVEAVRDELHRRHGLSRIQGVRNWLERGRLSADGMLMLMGLADERGIAYRREDFLIEERHHAETRRTRSRRSLGLRPQRHRVRQPIGDRNEAEENR